MRKYVEGSKKLSAKERVRVTKFIELWTMSSHLVGAFRVGGSISVALVFLQFLAGVEKRERAV